MNRLEFIAQARSYENGTSYTCKYKHGCSIINERARSQVWERRSVWV